MAWVLPVVLGCALMIGPPSHLRYLGYYDRYAPDQSLPHPPVTARHANLYTERNLTTLLRRHSATGLPGLIMLQGSEWWAGMRSGKAKSGSALLPGWETRVDEFAHAVSSAPAGAVRGVQLGDELVCMGLPLSNLSAIAARLRPRLPQSTFIYTNECFVRSRRSNCAPRLNGTDCPVKNKGTQVPGIHNECLPGGFCADRVWPFIPGDIDYISLDSYCRGDKYCNVSADVVGEAAAAAEEAGRSLMPLLQPHQRLWAVPGLFGPSSSRSPAAARDAYDNLLVDKLRGWMEVVSKDSRWVGIMGWRESMYHC